jgi:hypothetical protein
MKNSIEWDIDVSILTNRFIMLEVARVLAIAFLFTGMIVTIILLPSLMDGPSLPMAPILLDSGISFSWSFCFSC